MENKFNLQIILDEKILKIDKKSGSFSSRFFVFMIFMFISNTSQNNL